MNEPLYTVREVRGLDLEPGARCWLNKREGAFSDGGYFAKVERVVPFSEQYVSGVEVEFEWTDPWIPRERIRFVMGSGSDRVMLVLVKEGSE